MKVVLVGGTGLIGSALSRKLVEQGHSITVLTRSSSPPTAPKISSLSWNPGSRSSWEQALEDADALVNLAGEPIAARRWTDAQKEKIRGSRIATTRALVDAMARARQRPAVFLNGSAVGYYGSRGDEALGEEAPPGGDFLARVCVDWEAEAQKAEQYGMRVIRLRTGIVLAREGGALAKMVPPFKFFAGGPLGSGKQWMSWIHIEDEVGLIVFLLGHAEARGAVNATAPEPVTMRDFCRTLAKVLRRPSWAPVPGFALRLLLGEMADMLLTGQRVLPRAALKWGYQFRYVSLAGALEALMPL